MEHRGPGKPIGRPPALAPLVVESSPGPIASEPVTIFRGPGRRVTKAPTWNNPRPALADQYDDDLPPAA
jgi:hypothetical protein